MSSDQDIAIALSLFILAVGITAVGWLIAIFKRPKESRVAKLLNDRLEEQMAIDRKFLAEKLRPPMPQKTYAETVEPYASALRMMREGIEEIFGPIANTMSEEGVLLNFGPEPTHEAQALLRALRNVGIYMSEREGDITSEEATEAYARVDAGLLD